MLCIKNLTCGYSKDKPVLRGINLNIEQGECVGIIGPNGSGKTTLLRAITGILKPVKGGAFLRGKNLESINRKNLARDIAVVSQSAHISSLSVEDYVMLARIPYFSGMQFIHTRKDQSIVNWAMDITDTSQFKDKLMHTLSEGQRQRVLIARALAQQPNILILDEPTAHLDISHELKILDLIQKINQQGSMSVIMILHDLNLAAQYCGKLVLMRTGNIYAQGTPRQVLTKYNIKQVYDVDVSVKRHEESGRPYVMV